MFLQQKHVLQPKAFGLLLALAKFFTVLVVQELELELILEQIVLHTQKCKLLYAVKLVALVLGVVGQLLLVEFKKDPELVKELTAVLILIMKLGVRQEAPRLVELANPPRGGAFEPVQLQQQKKTALSQHCHL
jgi:hypothetical protein